MVAAQADRHGSAESSGAFPGGEPAGGLGAAVRQTGGPARLRGGAGPGGKGGGTTADPAEDPGTKGADDRGQAAPDQDQAAAAGWWRVVRELFLGGIAALAACLASRPSGC